jgi:FG-GAP-like repeat/Secretion system C-terminal sorting domain
MRIVIVFFGLLLPLAAFAELTWTESVVDYNFAYVNAAIAGDVDGDGDLDVIAAGIGVDEVAWWENVTGDATSWTKHIVASNYDHPVDVFAIDVNGDGNLDVIAAGEGNSEISWWDNEAGDGLNWIVHSIDSNYLYTKKIHAADMDGDGDTDVFAAGNSTDFTWWENTDGGGLTWAEYTIADNLDNPIGVYATDIDGDGDTDVLGVSNQDDDVFWWENVDGSGLSMTHHFIDESFSAAWRVQSADLDGDGDQDVLASSLNGFVTWWKNVDGVGLTWTRFNINVDFEDPYGLFSSDIDGDGDMDVLGAARDDNEISWWENVNANATVWTKHDIDLDFRGATSVYAADMNADDDMDVLGAAWDVDEIAVWLQFNHDPVEVSITPSISPTIVEQGSSLNYSAAITSYLEDPQRLDIWTLALTPDGTLIGPIWRINNFPLTPGGNITVHDIWQHVPSDAPPATYQFGIRTGDYPNQVLSQDYFEVEVIPAPNASGIASRWIGGGYEAFHDVKGSYPQNNSANIPQTYSISDAYPNPFNPTTALTINLPDAAELNVQVFNITGRQVALLANGQINAGLHTLTFDASRMASGLYFIRVVVPGQLNQVQKVMLVR